ncbi:MAG TPA: chemotaxis protein CheA [Myxococcales bacterium]|nr:chemotaxis protein CheA [Myxococcales bacterium]
MPEGPHRYLSTFLAESGEQLEGLARELVRAEQEPPDGALWDSMFRRIHSIKGGAAQVGLTAIVDVAHAAESLMGKLKTGRQKPSREQVDLLLRARDMLMAEVERAAKVRPENEDAELVARLQEAARAIPEAVVTPPPPVAQQQPKVVVDPSLPLYDVFVTLAKTCQAPGARASIVQRKLKALGAVLEFEPSPQQLMQKKGGARVAALVSTSHTVDEIRGSLANVPEVEQVEVKLAPVTAAPQAPHVEAQGALRALPEAASTEEPRMEATVRVRATALDQLLDQAAEVLHGIARLREASRKLPETAAAAFEAEIDRLRRTARELHGRVMDARLTPFSALTERLPRTVRDLAHRLDKEIDVELHGAEVELDRTVIDALGDPLTHLVRNAVDHGFETPVQRLTAGKSERGKLVLTARRERDKVLVEVTDDGRGFDVAELRKRAVLMGALTAQKSAELTDSQACELAFLPGLSTRAEATETSGRGVGLDVVKSTVEKLGGKLSVKSTRGLGTAFTLELPLSVSMANLLLVQVAGELYGLPLHRVVVTTENDLMARGGEGFEARSLAVMGQLVRAYSLAKLFGLPSLAPPGPRPFAVLEVDGVRFALAVDRLVGQEEAVLKPLFPPLDKVKGLAGATVLGNGRPLLVLDPRGLLDLAEGPLRLKGAA